MPPNGHRIFSFEIQRIFMVLKLLVQVSKNTEYFTAMTKENILVE